MEFSEPTRRRALWALGGAGLAVIGAGDAARERRPPEHPIARPTPRGRTAPHPRPSTGGPPGWRPGQLRALHRPVAGLHDLAPAAPPKAIALTLDDGPDPEWTPRILDLLAEHAAHASFCLIGEQVKGNEALVRRIVAAGHQICNHSMTHRMPFDRLPTAVVRREVVEAHARISEASGVAPMFFRSPGGVWPPRVLDVVAEQGLLPLDWSVDTRDWSRPGTAHIKFALLDARPGAIMLCHDGGGDRSQTLGALRAAIPRLKKRGLEFVALGSTA